MMLLTHVVGASFRIIYLYCENDYKIHEGEYFHMDYNFLLAFIPFWILGLPLIVALIILGQLLAHRENALRSDVDAGGTPSRHTV